MEVMVVWTICADDCGREIEITRPELDREERAERTDPNGRSVGWRGLGAGVSMGIWGMGGGGGPCSLVFARKIREPTRLSANVIAEG